MYIKIVDNILIGSGAVSGKMLLVTNPSWIWDVSRSSSTRNNLRTANGYKCWSLQLYKNPSTTCFEMILVLVTFHFSFLGTLLLFFPNN